MASGRVNMKGYFKQTKKGNSGISKRTSTSKKSTPPSHSASIGSDIVQSPSPLSSHVSPKLNEEYDGNEEVLRQFDMNMAYGPCIGMTRLDRWSRASKLGLNPPKEVAALLNSAKVRSESLWDNVV